MIKLFSLNHTRIRRFSILAQDKTQFRRVTVLIFRVRNTSASAHTNYLVNFLKSVERLLNQGRVFYIESRPCQPLIFSVFKSLKSAKNRPAYCFKRGAHSTLNRHLVNRFLKKSENHFLQSFQAVTPSGRPCLSGLSLRSGAHSTALRKTVNDESEKNANSPLPWLQRNQIDHAVIKTLAIFFLPAWMTQSSPSTNMRPPSNCLPST